LTPIQGDLTHRLPPGAERGSVLGRANAAPHVQLAFEEMEMSTVFDFSPLHVSLIGQGETSAPKARRAA
jgi:hypothetical protein